MAWETGWVTEKLLQRAEAGARKYMNLFFWEKKKKHVVKHQKTTANHNRHLQLMILVLFYL